MYFYLSFFNFFGKKNYNIFYKKYRFIFTQLSKKRLIKTENKGLFSGGENGIRTHEKIAPLHAFQACALNHSAISPIFFKFRVNYNCFKIFY